MVKETGEQEVVKEERCSKQGKCRHVLVLIHTSSTFLYLISLFFLSFYLFVNFFPLFLGFVLFF